MVIVSIEGAVKKHNQHTYTHTHTCTNKQTNKGVLKPSADPLPRGVLIADALSVDAVRSCDADEAEETVCVRDCEPAPVVDAVAGGAVRGVTATEAEAEAEAGAVVVVACVVVAASFFIEGDSGTDEEGVGEDIFAAVAADAVVAGFLSFSLSFSFVSCFDSLRPLSLSLSLSLKSVALFRLPGADSSESDNFLIASAKSVSRCEGLDVANKRAATGTTGGPASTTERERARFRLHEHTRFECARTDKRHTLLKLLLVFGSDRGSNSPCNASGHSGVLHKVLWKSPPSVLEK